MEIFDLPSPLWNKVFDYVLNSRDSTVADLLAATVLQPHFANFELKSVEFQATNDTSVVKLGINGRQPMEVHLTELDLARKTLLPFLHKTTNFTVVGVNKNQKWLDALFWTEASELIEHLVIADSQISPFLLEFVAKSYAHNVSFIKCTSTQDFTFNMDWHTKSLLLYECSPVFVARIAEKAMYSTTDLQQFEVHMNFLDESVDLNRVKFIEGAMQEPTEQRFDFEWTYWKRISRIIVANPEITVAFYVQDGDLQLAFMLLVFYRNHMLEYAEYENASSTLKMSPRNTVAFGRIFMMHRLFINGCCYSPRRNDMIARFEAEHFLEKRRQSTECESPAETSASQASMEVPSLQKDNRKNDISQHHALTVVKNSVSLVA
ncbi:unnamed protein product, partial [Mesorhabditis belari]|uniref:Uncharacterized protein n=1 Tax=Mesorhabditis belari TaxID=2138241 RepID=A0AAF3EVI5_9BILA